MQWFKADLHIHTVLSPCADLSMGPQNIVQKAIDCGLDIIGITDHNSCENAAAVIALAESTELAVIPGMEVYTREEAHIICLLPDLVTALDFMKFIDRHLQHGMNDPDWFGRQYVVDEHEVVLRENTRLLSMPITLAAEEVLDRINALGGLAFPAHIDRKAHSILRTLGFIPSDWPIDAVEIAMDYNAAVHQFRFLKNSKWAVLSNSDAHHIDQLGKRYTEFFIEEPTLYEIALALKSQQGRQVRTINALRAADCA